MKILGFYQCAAEPIVCGRIVLGRALSPVQAERRVPHSFASFANEWVLALLQSVILTPSLPKEKDLLLARLTSAPSSLIEIN